MYALRSASIVVACTLFTVAPALASGPITSGVATSGSIANPTDTESWTFSGNAGQRVIMVAVTTSGTLNTLVTLRSPGGTVLSSTTADRSEFQLTSSGVHTIEVSDLGSNDAGTYIITYLNLTAGPLTHAGDLDGGSIASGEVRAGTIGTVADLDAFTFTGVAGQRVLFGALEGTALPFNTTLWLYPPAGAPLEASTSGGNKIDVQLAASGTYTVLVEDVANDHTGSYTVSYLNVSGGPHTFGSDLDGGPIASATQASGTMNDVIDWDAFTFTGSAGDRIVVVALATGGAMNTSVALYPPNGGPAQSATAADHWDFQLTQSGTHTLVVEDSNFGETGTYTLALLNVTSGPLTTVGDPDGGAIASGEVRAATIGTVTDIDAFTFSGVAGQRVLFGALEGTALPFNTTMWLFPPSGGGFEISTSGGNKIDVQLAATGTYTAVVEDVADDHTGSYTVSYLNVSGGPHTFGSDLDGGAIASGARATGTMDGVIDWDAYTFTGSVGDRIVVVGITTSGTMNTSLALYPPNGGPAQMNTAADRWEFQLTQSGTHALVVEDSNFGETGTYALTWLNVTSGPYTTAGDLDGGSIASDEIRAGSIGTTPDIDAFTFSAAAGDRVVLGGVATGGPAFNTVLWLFPPGGGASLVNTSGGDRIDLQLPTTGTYVALVQDVADDTPGTYALSFVDVTSGPLTSAGDPDGGLISPGDVRIGTVSPVPDLDVYWFFAGIGDMANVSCVTTSGSLNTTTYLYPPGGGNPVVSTSADVWSYPTTIPGRYALLVQHSDFTQTGGYQLGLSGSFSLVDVPGPSLTPARLNLSVGRPNPSGATVAFTIELPRRSPVSMRIYDVRGALVRTLEQSLVESGTHTLAWDGRDDRGRPVAGGLYLAWVHADGESLTRRVVRVE